MNRLFIVSMFFATWCFGQSGNEPVRQSMAWEAAGRWDSLCARFAGAVKQDDAFTLIEHFLKGNVFHADDLGPRLSSRADAAACACRSQGFEEMFDTLLASSHRAEDQPDIARQLAYYRRAKNFLEGNEDVRQLLADHPDIHHYGYWSRNPLWHFKKALAFWYKREMDGTKAHFEQVLREAAALLAQKKAPESMEKGIAQSGAAAFFTPTGLSYDPTSAHLFDKTYELFEAYLEECFRIEYGLGGREHEDRARGEIKDPGLIDTLMNLGSIYFRKEFDYYALIWKRENEYAWKKVTPQPRLIVDFVESCETWDVFNLTIATADNDSVILFSAIPRNPPRPVPSGYFPLAAPTRIEMALSCTQCDTSQLYSAVSDTAWEWNIPPVDSAITRLFAVGWHGTYNGRHLHRIELYMENAEGEAIKLDETSFCGHMFCLDARFSDPYLTDANGDGLIDIIIDASDEEKVLYLQRRDGSFDKRTIHPYATHRAGGC
ncbi:MAG: FG-GAP repeat domain-containing protein [Chitinispirillaceae bacterium]